MQSPDAEIAFSSVPSKTSVLGVTGCGEAGRSGSLPCVMNANSDALGGRHVDMPAKLERVWQAFNGRWGFLS